MKTKEEILQSRYVHDKGLNNEQYVLNAMQEYADQQLAEYKKKLKLALTLKIKQLEDERDGDPWYNGAITELTEFEKVIDQVTPDKE